jgi:SHS2 domain-containing protein
MGYEHLDYAGDAGVQATGETLKEVFEQAALGMYALMTDLSRVEDRVGTRAEATAPGTEGLLVSWLNELLYLFDSRGLVGCAVTVDELEEGRVAGTVRGETFDPGRHGQGLLVKAATYHDVAVELKAGGWRARVIFDI